MLNMGKEEMPEEPALTKEEMALPAPVGGSILDPHSYLLQPSISNVPTQPTAPVQPDAGAAHDK